MPKEFKLILNHADEPGYTPDIECYLRHGGYEVLKKALTLPPKALPDGKTQEETIKAGESRWTPAVTHAVENLSDKDMEGILVELKSKAPAKPAPKAAQ